MAQARKQTQFELEAFSFDLTAAAMQMKALAALHDPDKTVDDRAEAARFYEEMVESYQERAAAYRRMAVGDYSSEEAA